MERQFINLALLCMATPLVMNANETENRHPNILFCIADDAGHMGAYGHEWLNTPAFDRVAQQGILFNNMFTCNAKSAPSRATMITGRNSWQLEEACNHWPEFPAKFKSFSEALAQCGYEVACTGKGWAPGIANDSLGNPRKLTGEIWNNKVLTPPTKTISKEDYAGNFEEFMAHWDRNKPFCFWYGSREPHRGYEFKSSERFGKKTSDIERVPAYWPDNDTIRTDMLDYAVEIEHFDHHLGRILNILEEAGELDNTLIIVTSDHGMPFPRCKGQAYYHANHIPLAVMWKNGITNPGTVSDEFISSIDLAPTILEVAGVKEEDTGMQPITGRSFVDILKGENKGIDRNFVLIGKERHDVGRPFDQGYPIRGIIRGDFLYIRNFEIERWPAGNPETGYPNADAGPTKTMILNLRRQNKNKTFWDLSFGKRAEEEMFNIKKDPDCMNNLANQKEYEQLKKSMEKEMFQHLLDEGDPRVFGRGEIFDHYPNLSPSHDYWERTRRGEKVRATWIRSTDFETEKIN